MEIKRLTRSLERKSEELERLNSKITQIKADEKRREKDHEEIIAVMENTIFENQSKI